MGRPEMDVHVASSIEDAASVSVFLNDAHANGVEACICKLDQYNLSDVQRATISAIYDRYRYVDTDHWTRMIDSLHLSRTLDSFTFSQLNERRDVDASFDERLLAKGRTHDERPGTGRDITDGSDTTHAAHTDSNHLPYELYSTIERHSDANARNESDIGNLTAMVEWLYDQINELGYEVESLHAIIKGLKTSRHSKLVDVQFRTVDEHAQIQFCGPSTFLVKDYLKPLGATWIATSRMWVVSKEKGIQFMNDNATEFSFIRIE